MPWVLNLNWIDLLLYRRTTSMDYVKHPAFAFGDRPTFEGDTLAYQRLIKMAAEASALRGRAGVPRVLRLSVLSFLQTSRANSMGFVVRRVSFLL